MKALTELSEALNKVIEAAKNIDDECNKAIWENAPRIIHQRFCSKLVYEAKANPDKTPSEIPEAIKVMTALDVLEELYPELKK